MRQEEISFAFAQGLQGHGLQGHGHQGPASLKMDPSAQTVGVFGPGGIPGPVLDNCLTVS